MSDKITVIITPNENNNSLVPSGGIPSDVSIPYDQGDFNGTPMSKAEFSAVSLSTQFLTFMIHLAHNKKLRDAFSKAEKGDTKNPELRKMLENSGIIIPEYVDWVYLAERKKFCGVNYCKNPDSDNPIAVDIEETGIRIKNTASDEQHVEYEGPGLDIFSTEEIAIIGTAGNEVPGKMPFETYKCRISDYPLGLKNKYKYYYFISHPKYQELNVQIEGIKKEDYTISVRVPYIDLKNQAIQNYKLKDGEDDIVLCSC